MKKSKKFKTKTHTIRFLQSRREFLEIVIDPNALFRYKRTRSKRFPMFQSTGFIGGTLFTKISIEYVLRDDKDDVEYIRPLNHYRKFSYEKP